MLFQCRATSKTLGKHRNSFGWRGRVCWGGCRQVLEWCWASICRHWASNGLRRWPNIKPASVGWAYIVCTRHMIETRGRTIHWEEWNGYRPAPAMVIQGIKVEDIFELVTLAFSCMFWITALEKDQYSYVYKILSRIWVNNTYAAQSRHSGFGNYFSSVFLLFVFFFFY